VDGDTLDCAGERVRLAGLDTPERNGACAEERALADAATRRMRGLIADGVALERRGVDRYGRTLAVARDAAGRDVAQVMIGEGLARTYAGGRRAPWCPPARWR
jgi:endonuclease YncB( thermonuclease family)